MCGPLKVDANAGQVSSTEGFHLDGPRAVAGVANAELVGQVVGTDDDEEDQCELPSCALRILTAGGYNRHHHEVEVRMHMRASVYT